MNNQEAIQELIAFYGYYAGELREECSMAISALEKQIPMSEDSNAKTCQNCFEKSASPNSNLCKDCDDATINWDGNDLDELIEGIEQSNINLIFKLKERI
jgi:hypothetical protein